MPILIDTNVAIHLRDGDPAITALLDTSGTAPIISVVTLVELQAGLNIGRHEEGSRRSLLSAMLRFVPVLQFTESEAHVYGEIVARTGHDRRRVLDRMIAAQAIVAGLRLVTINGRDFDDIPDLNLEVWPSPTAPPDPLNAR